MAFGIVLAQVSKNQNLICSVVRNLALLEIDAPGQGAGAQTPPPL